MHIISAFFDDIKLIFIQHEFFWQNRDFMRCFTVTQFKLTELLSNSVRANLCLSRNKTLATRQLPLLPRAVYSQNSVELRRLPPVVTKSLAFCTHPRMQSTVSALDRFSSPKKITKLSVGLLRMSSNPRAFRNRMIGC